MMLGSGIFSLPIVTKFIRMLVIVAFHLLRFGYSYITRAIARIFTRKLVWIDSLWEKWQIHYIWVQLIARQLKNRLPSEEAE